MKVQDIINKIEGEGFEIATMIKRELIKEEIVNLYYHLFEDSSFEKLERYLRNGECMILMLTCEKADPITKWREMIGPNDPAEAKVLPRLCNFMLSIDFLENLPQISSSTVWQRCNQEWVSWVGARIRALSLIIS